METLHSVPLLIYNTIYAIWSVIMAVNKPYGDNARIGAVRERTQVFNPQTQLWTKRDTETGQFMSVKKTGGVYKGVTKEK